MHEEISRMGFTRGLKIAVAGKGGVGKTFIAGTLARLFGRRGYRVLAIDCDPNPNLHAALGIGLASWKIRPISDDPDLVEERTGVRPGAWGMVFSLMPKVDDIPDRYYIPCPDGVKLLIMGMPRGPSTGCMCPQNALIRELVRNLVLKRDEVVIMDMEAGLEHLGRGTARGVDIMLIVMEPTKVSVETACRISIYARELGIARRYAVVNKVIEGSDMGWIRRSLGWIEETFMIPFDGSVPEADLAGISPLDYNPDSKAVTAVYRLMESMLRGAGDNAVQHTWPNSWPHYHDQKFR